MARDRVAGGFALVRRAPRRNRAGDAKNHAGRGARLRPPAAEHPLLAGTRHGQPAPGTLRSRGNADGRWSGRSGGGGLPGPRRAQQDDAGSARAGARAWWGVGLRRNLSVGFELVLPPRVPALVRAGTVERGPRGQGAWVGGRGADRDLAFAFQPDPPALAGIRLGPSHTLRADAGVGKRGCGAGERGSVEDRTRGDDS